MTLSKKSALFFLLNISVLIFHGSENKYAQAANILVAPSFGRSILTETDRSLIDVNSFNDEDYAIKIESNEIDLLKEKN